MSNKLELVKATLYREYKVVTIGSGKRTRVRHTVHNVLEVNKLLTHLVTTNQQFCRTRFGILKHSKKSVKTVGFLSEFSDSLRLFFLGGLWCFLYSHIDCRIALHLRLGSLLGKRVARECQGQRE